MAYFVSPPKSLPVYSAPIPDPMACHHVVVDDGLASASARAFSEWLAGTEMPVTRISQVGKLANVTALQAAITALLADAHAGIHVYVFGAEPFLWDVRRLVVGDCGLVASELTLIRPPSFTQKRIYCVHCSTLQTHLQTQPIHCIYCGVALGVRLHFSQRLGAYLGVCLDADRPYGKHVR